MKKILIIIVVVLAATLAVAGYLAARSATSPGAVASPSAGDAAATVVTLDIEGMTCGACEIAVTQVLKRVDGVKSVRASFDRKNAVVSYDPTRVTPEALARSVEQKLPTYKASVARKRGHE